MMYQNEDEVVFVITMTLLIRREILAMTMIMVLIIRII